MAAPGTTKQGIDRSREDSAGDFVLLLSNTILALSAGSMTVALLGALQAFADDSPGAVWSLLAVAGCSAVILTMSAAWSALWAKLRSMADDLQAIRQHVEKTREH